VLKIFDCAELNRVLDLIEGTLKYYFLRRILELTRRRLVGHTQCVRETDLYNFPVRGTRRR